MDYWQSNLWLFVLCIWVAFLVFSPDRTSAKISAAWLVLYYLAAPATDLLCPLIDNQKAIQTICGVIAAVSSYAAFVYQRPFLSRILAVAAVCHFIYFVILMAGSNVDAAFFVTFYSVEVLVVFVSMGVISNASRDNSPVCGSLGGSFHDNRGGG